MTAGFVEARLTVPASTTLSATTNAGGPTSVTVTAGTYYPTDLCSHLKTQLDSQRSVSGGAWTVSLSTGDGGTGRVTISVSAGSFSITWSTAALGTLLGHTTITTQTSVTGANACHGVFIPNCTLQIDSDPRIAPIVTDLRETISPTGFGLGLVGNARYRHTRVRWAHVTRTRALDTDSADPSWERFIVNAHLGQGHSWFTPMSYIKITDHTAALIGSTSNKTRWKMVGVRGLDPRKFTENWSGLWTIEIPEIVSDGT